MADTTTNTGVPENALHNATNAQFEAQNKQKEQAQQGSQLETAAFLDGVRTALRALDTKVSPASSEQVLSSINALIDQLPDTITPQDVDSIMTTGMTPLEKSLRTLSQSRQMTITMGNEQLINYSA